MAFVRAIHRSPVDYPHKGPVTRKMFPFDDVIMEIVVFPSGMCDDENWCEELARCNETRDSSQSKFVAII